MTPKEKANKLVDVFRMFADGIDQEIGRFSPKICKENAKQCALIAVEEILNLEPPELSYMEPFSISWWQQVKQEIEKL